MARTRASSRALTEPEEIRRWAEERNARPACVRGTGGTEDVGMIRLDFPGYSGAEKLEEISWDDWFEKFDERNLALLVQDETASGQKSNFNKLVSRQTAASPRRRETWDEMESARGATRRTQARTRTVRGTRPRATTRTRSRTTARSRRGRTAGAQAGRTSRRTTSARANQRGQGKRGRSARKGAARVTSITARGRSSRARGTSSRNRKRAA